MEIPEFKELVFTEMRKINENLELLFRPVYEEFGLTMMQVRILMNLEKEEDVSVGALSKTMSCAVGNISAACRKLEEGGYLNRVRDKRDERIVRVALSEKGRSAIEKIGEAMQKQYAGCLDAFSNEDLDTMMIGLRRLNDLFCRMVLKKG